MPSSAAPQNTNNGLPVDLECSEEEDDEQYVLDKSDAELSDVEWYYE